MPGRALNLFLGESFFLDSIRLCVFGCCIFESDKKIGIYVILIACF